MERLHPSGLAVVGYALWFSLLSAFHIGWRELNVGSWLARLQAREYLLRATSWVRVVSGTQSLISVYLLAIWALTYFGRPSVDQNRLRAAATGREIGESPLT